MEALCHDTRATTSVLPCCALPMAHLAKRQEYRPLSVSQSLGARCLEARCLWGRYLGARCLGARGLGLQTSLEAEMLPRTVNSGGRYVNMYRHRALSAIMPDAVRQLQLAGSPQPSKITPSFFDSKD